MRQFLTNDTTITNTATVTGVAGALLMALNLNVFILAYSLFITSSILWALFAYKNKNNQLLIMNIIFTVINLIGLIRFN